jgi:hypothetical protein
LALNTPAVPHVQDKLHGGSLRWWLRVEDPRYDRLHHAELWTLTKKMAGQGAQKLGFTIPLAEPLPGAFYLRLLSDSWLHVSRGRLGEGGAAVQCVVILLFRICCYQLVLAASSTRADHPQSGEMQLPSKCHTHVH